MSDQTIFVADTFAGESVYEGVEDAVNPVLGSEQAWTWKRLQRQGMKFRFILNNRISNIDEMFKSVRNDTELMENFTSSCFGAFPCFDTSGASSGQALSALISREILVKKAPEDELWFRVNNTNLRFSKTEFALMTGLRFGKSSFDLHAEHTIPTNSVRHRIFRGSCPTVKEMFNMFVDGEYKYTRSKPSTDDRLKIMKILFMYLHLMGVDTHNKKIDPWVWALIEDEAGWESFPWGQFAFQILLMHLKSVEIEPKGRTTLYGCTSAFLSWAYEVVAPLGLVCATQLPPPHAQIPRMVRWKFNAAFELSFNKLKFNETSCLEVLEITPEEQRLYGDWWAEVNVPLTAENSLAIRPRRNLKRKLDIFEKPETSNVNNMTGSSADENQTQTNGDGCTGAGKEVRDFVAKAISLNNVSLLSSVKELFESRLKDFRIESISASIESPLPSRVSREISENNAVVINNMQKIVATELETFRKAAFAEVVDEALKRVDGVIAAAVAEQFNELNNTFKCTSHETGTSSAQQPFEEMERCELVQSQVPPYQANPTIYSQEKEKENRYRNYGAQEGSGQVTKSRMESSNQSMKTEPGFDMGRQIEAVERIQMGISLDNPGINKLKSIKIEQGINRAFEEKILSLEKEIDVLKEQKFSGSQVINKLSTELLESRLREEKLRESRAKAERNLEELQVVMSNLESGKRAASLIIEEMRRDKSEADCH